MRNSSWCAGLSLALLVAATPAAAQDKPDSYFYGNDLYATCTAKDAYSAGSCMGFVIGVTYPLKTRELIHVPEGVTHRDIVVKYLADHQEKRHLWSLFLISMALNKAFPAKSTAR